MLTIYELVNVPLAGLIALCRHRAFYRRVAVPADNCVYALIAENKISLWPDYADIATAYVLFFVQFSSGWSEAATCPLAYHPANEQVTVYAKTLVALAYFQVVPVEW